MSFVFFIILVAAALHPFGETKVFRLWLFRSPFSLAAGARATAILTPSYASSNRDTNDTFAQVFELALAEKGQEGVTMVPEADLTILFVNAYLQIADSLSSDMAHVDKVKIQNRHLEVSRWTKRAFDLVETCLVGVICSGDGKAEDHSRKVVIREWE